MAKSNIEWLKRPETIPWTWNPLQDVRKGKSDRGYHCTKISPGCKNCWAEVMNKRFGNGLPFDDASTDFELVGMDEPLKWRKPRTVGVQLMGDLFHEEVGFVQIANVFNLMVVTPKHTYIVLTKRSGRMLAFLDAYLEFTGSPLPDNIWGMVTVESQEQSWRIDDLLKSPFAVRGVSVEPMLGEIDMSPYLSAHCNFCGGTLENHRGERRCSLPYWGKTNSRPGIDWIIVGAESGSDARPMRPDWPRMIRDQCQIAGVPFFFKQWGENPNPWCNEAAAAGWQINEKKGGRLLDGREWNEFPA